MQYDKFQIEAIDYINKGYSVIVSAPTGAGKTAIAEYVIEKCIEKNEGVIYTAPIKALSNQKYRDFSGNYKEMVGILTGDVSINPSASVLIMTTEIFRNKVLDEPESLKGYSWVIFDEIHYIDNEERGTVWEESLIFMPEYKNILCLSATIPNIKEFATWIESVHKVPMKIVNEYKRPVPLQILFQCNDEIMDLEKLKKIKFDYKKYHYIKQNKLATIINHLKRFNQLPCIYFLFGRQKTEDMAFELYNFDFLSNTEKNEITSLYISLCRQFNLENEKNAKRLFNLIQKGIAYHHAGMLPTLKEIVEQLFTSRLIKVIFTTETFALGINMPARSVVIGDLRKPYGKYFENLRTRDFYQMAGRSGRRGIDEVGFVYVPVNKKWITDREVEKTVFGQPEYVTSQLNLSYATILNLYKKHKEKLIEVYPYSLHFFQSTKHKKKEALKLINSRLKLLKDFGYIKNGVVTGKGYFACSVYGYELIFSELHEQGILDNLDKISLGILCVAVVFEPRKIQDTPVLLKNCKKIVYDCRDIFHIIKNKEKSCQIYPFSKEPFFHLAHATKEWLLGTEFPMLTRFTDTDEGEIIRYFRMAVQLLREISVSNYVSFNLNKKAVEVLKLLNRGIVDAEQQLRS
jgi:superfamily II RNA helicase